VKRVKESRDGVQAQTALDELRDAASAHVKRGGVQLMPYIIAAVRARATVGEISDILAAEWGRYSPAL
jgi:methylmalonyl-CoA mutase N-terminal domain/subunit